MAGNDKIGAKGEKVVPFDERNDPQDLPPPYESGAGPSNAYPAQGFQSQRPSGAPGSSFPGAHYNHAQIQQLPAWNPNTGGYYPQLNGPQAPYQYPPGYICQYCHNTGVKAHNGHLCGYCERNFGRQSANVMQLPPGMHMQNPNGVTYMAGDPRIGGRACGNCKGRGIRSSLFGMVEEQCENEFLYTYEKEIMLQASFATA